MTNFETKLLEASKEYRSDYQDALNKYEKVLIDFIKESLTGEDGFTSCFENALEFEIYRSAREDIRFYIDNLLILEGLIEAHIWEIEQGNAVDISFAHTEITK